MRLPLKIWKIGIEHAIARRSATGTLCNILRGLENKDADDGDHDDEDDDDLRRPRDCSESCPSTPRMVLGIAPRKVLRILPVDAPNGARI